MTDRMTPEQVAALRLPEGMQLRREVGYWVLVDSHSGTPGLAFGVGVVAREYANDHLPRSVYDWAWAAYQGRDVPTVEQWEAVKRLAEMAVNKSSNDEALRMAAIVSPQPAPVIAPCPYCGGECKVCRDGPALAHGYAVRCWAGHSWYGPNRPTDAEAIAAHNDVARKLRGEPKKEPQPEPSKRTCGGCRHRHPSGLCLPPGRSVAHNDRHKPIMPPDHDANWCDRWEPKP